MWKRKIDLDGQASAKKMKWNHQTLCRISIITFTLLGCVAIYNLRLDKQTPSENRLNFTKPLEERSGRGEDIGIVSGEETESNSAAYSSQSRALSVGNNLPRINFTNIANPTPSFQKYAYISGDLVMDEDGIIRVKKDTIDSKNIQRHSIESEHIDGNSIISRTIKNNTIQGKDINRDTEIVVAEIIADDLTGLNLAIAQSIDLGTNQISDGMFTGDWNFGSGNITTAGTISGSFAGSFAPSGDVDMTNHIFTNIGNAGTDFTSAGGLNLAGNLNIGSGNFLVDAATGSATIGSTVLMDTNGLTAPVVTTVPFNSGMIVVGDSICAYTPGERWSDLLVNMSQFSGHLSMNKNTCVSGRSINDIAAGYDTEVYPYRPSQTGIYPTYLMVDIGSNSLSDSGSGANAAYSAIQSYWQRAKNDGFTVVAFTVLPRGTSSGGAYDGNNIERYNSLVKSSSAGSYSLLVDQALALSNPYDSNFFNADDHTHPNSAGHRMIANYINSVFGGLGGFQTIFDGRIGSASFACDPSSLPFLTTGTRNTACGVNSLGAVTSGGGNASFGSYALSANTTGNSNTAFGNQTLWQTVDGSRNVASGYASLYTNISGSNNTAIGFEALFTSTASDNTAVGSNALYFNTTGTSNVALGVNALYLNSTGNVNIAVGKGALQNNRTGTDNVAVGGNALYANTSTGNTAVGSNALFTNSSGNSNTAIGYYALELNSTGNSNTAIGTFALYNATGSANTAIGNNAGRFQSDGSTALLPNNSVYIGAGARGYNNSDSNAIVIGYGAIGEGANATVIGSSSTVKTHLYGNVGIGTTSPGTKLQVTSSSDENVVTITDSDGTCTLNPESGGSWSCTSDERLKTDINPALDTLDKILTLRPVSFKMKIGGDVNHGFIAQEVQEVIPEAVSTLPNGYLGVAEGKFTPYIIGAIKELSTTQDKQQTAITGLTNNQNKIVEQLTDKLASQTLTAEEKIKLIGENLDTISNEEIKTIKGKISSANDDISDLKDKLATLEEQMEKIRLQNSEEGIGLIETRLGNLEIALNVAGSDVNVLGSLSVAGDVDLLSGKLTAEDIEALGTVKAKNIEAEETIKGDNLELGEETRGKAEIEAGDKEAEIETKAVSNSSQIYITPLGKLGGGNLYVDMENVKEGKSFKVKLDGEELDSDIEFNWLIIK